MDKKIRCACGKTLARVKDNALIIQGKTDFIEDKEGKRITCILCKTVKKFK